MLELIKQSRTLMAEHAANPTSLASHCLLVKEMQQLKLHSGSETEKVQEYLYQNHTTGLSVRYRCFGNKRYRKA